MDKFETWILGDISESHEYVMKIVPTTYEDLGGSKIVAYQYTYAYRSYVAFGHGGKVIPAVWFRLDYFCISFFKKHLWRTFFKHGQN